MVKITFNKDLNVIATDIQATKVNSNDWDATETTLNSTCDMYLYNFGNYRFRLRSKKIVNNVFVFSEWIEYPLTFDQVYITLTPPF